MLDWYPLSFQSDGTMLDSDSDQLDGPNGIIQALNDPTHSPLTDLWILSYGWNTSVPGGDDFYQKWTDLLRSEIEAEKQQNRLPLEYQPLFIGIYWPSIILADTTSRPVVPPAPAVPHVDIAASSLAPHILRPVLVPHIAAAPMANLGTRNDFIAAFHPIFAPEVQPGDATIAQDFGAVYDFLVAHSVQKPEPAALSAFANILKKYQPGDPHADHPVSDSVLDVNAAAISQGITNAFSSFSVSFPTALDGLLEFLRVFSFWTMKARAGVVGTGLGPLINKMKEANSSLRIHLVGHSFGAKLLTSAVYSMAGPAPLVDSLLLFQGAFSQFAFSRHVPGLPSAVGPYVNIIEGGLVANPVAVIYSQMDLANKNLYPLGMAPILDPGMILFDLENLDTYHQSSELRGAIGANGMQGVDDIMLPVTLPWQDSDSNVASNIRCINLNRTPILAQIAANDFVGHLIGAHSDVDEPQIFHGIVEVSRLNQNA
jgi:hypothetical protein